MTSNSGLSRARLVTVRGRGAGTEYLLGPANTLGRDPENTIQVLDEKISRHHAVLRKSDGVWTLQDLGSRNGTFLGSQRLVGAMELHGGEEIHFGDTVLRFELDGSPRASPALPPALEALEPLELPSSVAGQLAAPLPLDAPDSQSMGGLGAGSTRSGLVIRNLPDRSIDIKAQEINPMIRAAADASGRALFKIEEGANAAELARRLEVSFEINKALSQLMEMEDLAECVLEELFKAVPATRGAVLIRTEDDQLSPLAIREVGKGRAAAKRLPISSTILNRVLERQEAVLMTDVLADVEMAGSASIVAQGIQSAISAPLIYQQELLGVLHLESRNTAQAFSKADLDLVASVAAQAAIAVANARLLAKVKKESEHRANLSRYLAPELVEQLLEGKLNLEMEGATCQVTVLFSDLRGFTAMSERLSSREVFTTLNEYFQRMVDVIIECGGSIDKFMGDAIMAVWGVPTPQENDTQRAVEAAIKMQQVLKSWNMEREAAGKEPVYMGVGINSGPALAGNLGARQRMEYTIIGDNVNLASRIEGLTSKGQVLISESTMALVRGLVDAVELPPAKVKGKQHPVKIFEVRGFQTKSQDHGVERSHGRMKTAVRITLLDPSGAPHVGLLVDISAGGAGIKFLPEQIQNLEEGAEVTLPFANATTRDAPSVRGKLVRLIHGMDKAGNVLFKGGIQFLDTPDKVKLLAKSLVKL
jgi:adenylate cyclase